MPFKDPTDPKNIESARLSRRKHYQNNKQAYIDRAKARAEEITLWVREQKDVPCTDCKCQYPYYVMQFDHVQGDKIENINVLLRRKRYKQLREEIKKCEVVCANCHAFRTWERLQKHAGATHVARVADCKSVVSTVSVQLRPPAQRSLQ